MNRSEDDIGDFRIRSVQDHLSHVRRKLDYLDIRITNMDKHLEQIEYQTRLTLIIMGVLLGSSIIIGIGYFIHLLASAG
jgi:hypothetical protein